LSFFRGGTAQFDQDAAGLERVYLKEHFTRRARHCLAINFGDGCNGGRSFSYHDCVAGFEVLGQGQ